MFGSGNYSRPYNQLLDFRQGGHGAINFLEAVWFLQPCFYGTGERLGAEKLFNYIRAFGFGVRSGLDYPGEGTGFAFPAGGCRPLELATTSFGRVSVTPLPGYGGWGNRRRVTLCSLI